MRRTVSPAIVPLLLGLQCATVGNVAVPLTELGPNERCAIESAEAFIEKNGYTRRNLTAEEWKAVAKEGIDTDNVSEMSRLRHDTLKPRAYGLIARPSGGWVVVFERTRPRKPAFGRGVKIEADCRAVQVIHSDYKLSEAKQITRP